MRHHSELLDTAAIPGNGGELRFFRQGNEFSIRIAGGGELMNTRMHGSEDALAELACSRIAGRKNACVLVGGLGMGFTLAAALRHLNADAQVVVAELVPAVVQWNRGPLGERAGRPLDDARTVIRESDVGLVLKSAQASFDAILLDVDNGPEGLTRKANDWLYSMQGLACAFAALRKGGVLAVWSAGPDARFTERLRKSGYIVEEKRVRAHGNKGARHIVWLAEK